MSSDQNTVKKRTTLSLPHEVVDRIDEYSEEWHLKSRSKAVEILALEALEDEEEAEDSTEGAADEQRATTDRGGASRSVSPLTLLGVVAVAITPALLVSGTPGLGVVTGAVAAAYGLLWVTAYDVVLERRLGDVRAELADAGGVVGFFRDFFERLTDDTPPVEDPDTLVERAANAQVFTLGLTVAAVTLAVPLYVVVELFGTAAVVDLIGATGAAAWVVGVVTLMYLAAAFAGISAVAMIAIVSAESGTDPAADEVRDAGR